MTKYVIKACPFVVLLAKTGLVGSLVLNRVPCHNIANRYYEESLHRKVRDKGFSVRCGGD